MLRYAVPVLFVVALLVAAGAVFVDTRFFLGFATGFVVPVIAVVGGLKVLAGMAKKQGAQLDVPPLPGGGWDYAWKVRGLDGAEVSFEAARGKVVFLNVWATWCAPCVAEMPSIQRLYETVRSDDVFFACVTTEPPDVASAFVAKNALSVPVFTAGEDLPSVFRSRGIPATFVLARDGSIAFRHVGAARWDDTKCVELIRKMVAGK